MVEETKDKILIWIVFLLLILGVVYLIAPETSPIYDCVISNVSGVRYECTLQ